jgi:hypothetical protein
MVFSVGLQGMGKVIDVRIPMVTGRVTAGEAVGGRACGRA